MNAIIDFIVALPKGILWVLGFLTLGLLYSIIKKALKIIILILIIIALIIVIYKLLIF